MTLPVLIELAIGDGADRIPINEADAVAAAAHAAGVAALRLLDGSPERPAIDPSVAAAYLAGNQAELGYLVDAPTTHNAPYNLARRVLSFDRATSGRVGVVLRQGEGDDVSDAVTPDPRAALAGGAPARWAEYAQVLTRLWESFPREALIGDQDRALVVEDALIAAIGHQGHFYRVKGPLDGPSSVQGRPVLVAVDPSDWAVVAVSADVIVLEGNRAVGADLALTAALEQVGRSRADVAVLGRIEVALADRVEAAGIATALAEWATTHRLDGLLLAVAGGADELRAVIDGVVPLLAAAPDPGRAEAGGTLRALLGLIPVARRVSEGAQ